MDDELEKIKRKLKKDFDDLLDVNPDSDIPVSEKKVDYKRIKRI